MRELPEPAFCLCIPVHISFGGCLRHPRTEPVSGLGTTGMESFTSFITRNMRINATGLVGTSLSVYLAGRLYYAKIDYEVRAPHPLVASFGHTRLSAPPFRLGAANPNHR
jgi:hypothetical protein